MYVSCTMRAQFNSSCRDVSLKGIIDTFTNKFTYAKLLHRLSVSGLRLLALYCS